MNGMPNQTMNGMPNQNMGMPNQNMNDMPNQNMAMPNQNMNGMPNQNMTTPNQNMKKKKEKKDKGNKKKSKLPLFLLLILIIVVVVFVVKSKQKPQQTEDMVNTETQVITGNQQEQNMDNIAITEQGNLIGSLYTDLLNNMHNFDAYALDSLIGPENGDSYLAQEWAYVNRVEIRQIFIQKLCSLVDFTNVDNVNGTVTTIVPDFEELNKLILEDKDYILQWYKSANYTEDTSYTFDEDLFNLFCQWTTERVVAIPTKTVELVIPNNGSIITDDSALDMALFSTEELHNCMRDFSKICVEFDGIGYTTRMAKVEQHNPEFDEWLEIFLQYYEEDGGSYDPVTGKFSGGKYTKKSKWEPWYVRDEDNNLVYDEEGNKIVNYFTVKDENGNDWVQPDAIIIVEEEVQEEIEVPWEEERGIPYGIIGTYYIQHEYDGVYDTVFRSGDGSVEYPAGFGTPIVTKLKGIDGEFHAVKVALLGYWVEQEAIDYEEAFSNKNRGFSVTSPVQLICFEYSIENLEDEPFAFDGSEMCLCNKNANVSARSGTLYGFYDSGILEPGKKYILNDWYSSTELYQKYVAWGRNFGRDYPLVFFDCLAGTGEIPTYSAYDKFTGKPTITESAEE